MVIIFTVCFVQPGTMVKCFFSLNFPLSFSVQLAWFALKSCSLIVSFQVFNTGLTLGLIQLFFILFGVIELSAGGGAKNNLDAALNTFSHFLPSFCSLGVFFWPLSHFQKTEHLHTCKPRHGSIRQCEAMAWP